MGQGQQEGGAAVEESRCLEWRVATLVEDMRGSGVS